MKMPRRKERRKQSCTSYLHQNVVALLLDEMFVSVVHLQL